MAYRWTENGPAFEFATPYGVENRFLAWRGYGLLTLALLVALVATFFENAAKPTGAVVLEAKVDEVLLWPHFLTASVLALFGILDLVRSYAQRVLRVERGHPAPLMPEVPHESAGASPGAVTLMRGLGAGELTPRKLPPAWGGLMRRLGAVDLAPVVSHTYLGARLAQLLLGVLLLLALGLSGAIGLALAKPNAATLVALLVGAVALGFATRQALLTGPLVLSPGVVAGVGALMIVLAAGVAWVSDKVPLPNSVADSKLSLAVALALALGLLFDFFGLMAMWEQLPKSRPAKVSRQEAALGSFGDPVASFQEVERELFRRWTDGVPNRRHLRQPPAVDRTAPRGNFKGTLFEETQPSQPPSAARPGGRWLRLLSAAGFAASLSGGLAWLWLAWTHMHDPQARWLAGVMGGACLVAGTYAMRLGHLPWSRVELQSTLLWLEVEGVFFRTGQGAGAATHSQEVTARVCTAQARSAFYAAAMPLLGSRTLLDWQPDTQTTTHWLDYLRSLGRATPAPPAAPSFTAPAMPAPAVVVPNPHAGRPRTPRVSDADTSPPVARRPARFCSNCGTPVLAGARFCQQCGNVLAAE